MLMKSARFWLMTAIAMSFLALAMSCGGNKDEDANANSGPKAAVYAKTGNEGTITGKITATGTAPAPKKIDMGADTACASKNPNATTQEWVVKDGKVQYTFVYIKDGTTADGKKIADLDFGPASGPANLDQTGCQYSPHVLGVQTNQEIDIKNSDPTTHNIHPTPKVNTEWNQSQTAGAADIKQKFTRAEILVPVKCNQHPWMKAYIGVVKHPFFAVSGADGSYTISGVPPGTYTVVAWHEKGQGGDEKTMQVTVASKGSGTADFAFDAGAATAAVQPHSLEVVPALEFPMLGHQ
jgi:hypothetical protein